MKRIIVFVIIVINVLTSIGQQVITMEEEGGVYKIPCFVNGAKMKMIFDTGAAKVSISKMMAEYLFENDFLSESDIKGFGQSKVADGRIKDNTIINIKDLEIAGLHIYNVDAWVDEELRSPLLLGQSAIQKLGAVTISGNQIIIYKAVSGKDSPEYKELEEQKKLFEKNRQFRELTRVIERMVEIAGPDEESIRRLAYAYMIAQDYAKSMNYCVDYMHNYLSSQKDSSLIEEIYVAYGEDFFWTKDYRNALVYYKLALEYCITDDGKYNNCQRLAEIYYELEKYNEAVNYYEISLSSLLNMKGLTIKYLMNHKIDDTELGHLLHNFAYALHFAERESDANRMMKAAANCNYAPAIKFKKEKRRELLNLLL